MTIRTTEEKKEILNRIKKAIASGTPVKEAVKAEGIHVSSYYGWSAGGKRGTQTRKKYKKRDAPALLSLPSAPDIQEERVLILMGNSRVIQTALDAFHGRMN